MLPTSTPSTGRPWPSPPTARCCRVRSAVAAILDDHGHIDGLVNNAGGQFPMPAEAIGKKGWESVLATNLTAAQAPAAAIFAQPFGEQGDNADQIGGDHQEAVVRLDVAIAMPRLQIGTAGGGTTTGGSVTGGSTAPASAVVSASVRNACMSDYFQFCAGMEVGSTELRRCFNRNGSKLSSATAALPWIKAFATKTGFAATSGRSKSPKTCQDAIRRLVDDRTPGLRHALARARARERQGRRRRRRAAARPRGIVGG